jgi:type I restriction enzyme, S subunit
MSASITGKAFAVQFKDLHLWSVGAHFNVGWQWPSEFIRPLSAALKRKTVEVDRKEHGIEALQLITLHFDGEIEIRNNKGEKGFKGRLYFADAGDVVYSKIDLRNGAIGIVPEGLKRVVVSSEYPVYEVREDVALPQYVKLLFRTNYFRKVINSLISGASGRKRVQPSQIEEIEVPFPPLRVQRAIVARWQKAQDEIASTYARVEMLKDGIETKFIKELGLRVPQRTTLPKAFAVLWEDLLRWGVGYNQQTQSGTDLSKCRYPVVQLNSILELVQYGTSEKANKKGKGVPVLRINNIKEGVLELSDLKNIDLPQKAVTRLVLMDRDILMIRTSGSRALVGTCAVFHETFECIFASYLIRLRFITSKVNSDYVNWFINSSLGRQQVNAISRQIMQSNLNSDEIRSLEIPLPPLDVQQEIMCHVNKGWIKIEQEREKAAKRAREIENDIEELILGTKQL